MVQFDCSEFVLLLTLASPQTSLYPGEAEATRSHIGTQLATSLALDMVVVSRCAGHLTAVLSREREREREVRDGKISARVARRAVPVSAEGVKKALPAPAASPVQAVRW